MNAETPTIVLLRKGLLLILLLGVVGTQIELLLLKHTDGIWQLAPLLLNSLTLAALAWYGLARSALSLRALQLVLGLCLASGGVGVIQHFLANIEYAQESDPSLGGSALYKEAVMGSTPTLAPGTMVQLALIGLAFVFRHPGLRSLSPEEHQSTIEA
ncbi:MAG: hypothetical protein H7Z40_10855 [Phycisphaerae bacterium]|nr:hypothetical protein [Gemmatimonadaceae bacterium]